MESAATSDEGMESLLRNFEQIYQGYKDALLEIQSLKTSRNYETRRYEALEATCNDLKTDNEQLRRLFNEPLSKFVDEMKYRTKCQSLTKELEKANSKLLSLEDDHRKMIKMLKHENEQKIHDLEKQVSCSLHKQASDQALMNQLQQDLATHETHIEILTSNFEQVTADLQSKFNSEIQELKDLLLAEQEEKNKLQVKLQNAENELQIIKKKQINQQRDSISLHHVETLKQKIMKLRKENESLKRQVSVGVGYF
ncbi:unnamed protein product [Musa acuminata subsp. malaccensis]|uniref:(wild Malaysian banana) hypothetical protein n=1 Tax=Musa acuminata subsp. malaccensis TaxID=214687 RepID=A0A804J0Y0_MUSAM|nr:unnamed protein product [Musa acuminata subsp. malaccensis]